MSVCIAVEGRGASIQEAMNDLARRLAGLAIMPSAPPREAKAPTASAPTAPAAESPAESLAAEPAKRRGRPRKSATTLTRKPESESEPEAPEPIPLETVRGAAQAYGTEYGGIALVEKIRQAGVPTGKLVDMKPAQYAAFLQSLTPVTAEAGDEDEDLGILPDDEAPDNAQDDEEVEL